MLPGDLEVVVGVADVEGAVDALGEQRDPRGLGLAAVQAEADLGGDGLEHRVQVGLGAAQVVVDAADLGVVQRGHEHRAVLVDEPHERERLGQHRVEPRVLVGEREAPLDLLGARLPVEVAGVVLAGEGPGEPALVEPQPVRVDARDDVPREPEPGAQAVVLRETPRQVQRGEPAHRLVGVRQADDQRGRPRPADGQRRERLALARRADPAAGDDAGVLGGQPRRLGRQLVGPGQRVAGRHGSHLRDEPAGQGCGHGPEGASVSGSAPPRTGARHGRGPPRCRAPSPRRTRHSWSCRRG